jgi:hypothetical protein
MGIWVYGYMGMGLIDILVYIWYVYMGMGLIEMLVYIWYGYMGIWVWVQ